MRTTKLKTRILLSLTVVLALVPATVLAFILQSALNARATEELQSEVRSLAGTGRAVQEGVLDATDRLLFALAEVPAVASADPAGSDEVFSRVIKEFPEYANIGLIDSHGVLIASGLPLHNRVNVSDRSYFRGAMATQSVSVGAFLVGRVSGKPSIIVAQPIVGNNGSVLSVLYAAIDLARFDRTERQLSSQLPRGSIYLEVDRAGTVVLDSRGSELVGSKLPKSLESLLERGSPGVRTLTVLDGVRRSYVASEFRSPFPSVGTLSIILGVPHAAVFGVAYRFSFLAIAVLVFAFGVGIAIVWLGVGRLETRTTRAKLSEVEQRYRRFVEEANDGILEADAEGRISFVNRRMADILASKPEELVGRKLEEFVVSEALEEYQRQERLRSAGMGGHYELRLKRPDGTFVWVIVSGSAYLDEKGNYCGSFGTLTDVTERKEMELRLSESEEKFRTFIEESPEAFFVTDEEGRLIEFNPAAERLTGLSKAWAAGKYAWEVSDRLRDPTKIERTDSADTRSQILKALETGEGPLLRQQIEGTLVRPDGSVCNFRWLMFPIKTNRGFRLGGVAVDTSGSVRIADRLRDSQAQLLRAQKMEAVGQLAGGIAHDFNNILTAIMGFGSLLSSRLASDPELLQYVQDIMASSRRAASLTQGLLTFGRRTKKHPVVVDLREVVRRQRQLLPEMIGEEIEVVLKLRGLARVRSDPADLDQIVTNLATNARDAMPEGGTITIELTTEEVQSPPPVAGLQPGRYAHLSFADVGVGMDQAVRAQMFEPFFTTKGTGKGVGLGLPIVWSIVEQYGGAVGIDSQVGSGTTVHVYLPVVGGEKAESPVPRERSPVGGGATILVAEDDSGLRDLLKTILTDSGYTVFVARDGEETLRRVEELKGRLQLVLLDVVMPKKTGPEIRSAIRELSPEARVIYMAGYRSELMRQGDGSVPHDPMILKPFSAYQLTEVVRRTLGR